MESINQELRSSNPRPAKRRQIGLLSVTAVVAALGGAAIAGGAVSAATAGSADAASATTIRLAQSVETVVPAAGDPVVATTPSTAGVETAGTTPDDDDTHDDCEFGDFDVEFGEDLPQELIDEINTESAELGLFLDGKGISYINETDELGLSFPAPADDDDAGWAAVDEFFEEKYGDFDDFDFGYSDFEGEFGIDEDFSQELIDEINTEGAELARFLDKKGVAYSNEADEFGISFPEPADDDDAGWAVVDEFFEEKYSDFDDFGGDGDAGPDTSAP